MGVHRVMTAYKGDLLPWLGRETSLKTPYFYDRTEIWGMTSTEWRRGTYEQKRAFSAEGTKNRSGPNTSGQF